jgi:hypothetical protein
MFRRKLPATELIILRGHERANVCHIQILWREVFANRRIVPYRNHFCWAIPIFQAILRFKCDSLEWRYQFLNELNF